MCLALTSGMLMYLGVGYFDESYDDETRGKCYTVAGLIGGQLATTVLALRWKDLNKKWEIDYFKASELEVGEGQFKKFRDNPLSESWMPFSEREKNLFRQIKTEYTNLIIESGVYCLGACLVLPDYHRLRKDNRLARKNLLHPYFQCAQMVLMESGMQVAEANATWSEETLFLKPIFDSHQKYEGRMKRAFGQFCAKNPNSSRYLHSPDYEDEKDHRALQAADNIAYEARRYLMHRQFNTPLVPRVSMSRLINSGSFLRLYKLDYRSLKIIAEGQSEDRIPVAPADVSLDEISKRQIGVIPND